MQIQILFNIDFEVIFIIVEHHIASTIKPMVIPKGFVTIVKVNTLIIDIKRKCDITNSSNRKQKLRGKRSVTPHASQIKLNETKPIKVIYTAINSKLVDIVRIQKAQGTETTPTQPRYNITSLQQCCISFIPVPPCLLGV